MRRMNRTAMLNRRAASPKSKPEEVMKALAVEPGSRIADIGPGGGFFTRKLAWETGPSGTVHALDLNGEWIERLEEELRGEGWENIWCQAVGASPETYPEASFDLVFMRNVCHHIEDLAAYFTALRKRLAPGARVAVIDYRPGRRWTFTALMGHYVDEEHLSEAMGQAGFERVQSHGFLPEQSFNIFRAASI